MSAQRIMFFLEYSCTDFMVSSEYALLEAPDALKVEFSLKPHRDIRVGGMDPPGGFFLPLIYRDQRLTHFYRVEKDLSLKLMSKDDFPRMLAGVVLDHCVGGITDPEGKEGYFILVDRRFYTDGRVPVISSNGLCYSRDVCRTIKKGEVIRGQFYLVPFHGNAAETVKAAVAGFCDPDPEQRWDLLAAYRERVKEPLRSFSVVADNPYFTAASGGTEHVFPQSPFPEAKTSVIKLESAKNQPVFSQIAFRAKKI